MGLIQAIGRGPVALDTVVFIYFMEAHSRFLPVVEPLFRSLDNGSLEGITCALTLLEVLVAPLRAGDQALAERYEQLLTRGRGLRMVDLDVTLLRAAAYVRARTGVRTPDSLQLAAALGAGCTALVTNDRKMPQIPGTKILQLSEFV